MSTKAVVFSRVQPGLSPEKQVQQTRQDIEVIYKQLLERIEALETLVTSQENRIFTLENEP